jgi:membrane protein implicated in regulation of membrane protease activity
MPIARWALAAVLLIALILGIGLLGFFLSGAGSLLGLTLGLVLVAVSALALLTVGPPPPRRRRQHARPRRR